jgi:hypothetical protein
VVLLVPTQVEVEVEDLTTSVLTKAVTVDLEL